MTTQVVDGERYEVTVLNPVEQELLLSEGPSRRVPRSVHVSEGDPKTHGHIHGCVGCRFH